ncbi:MAG: hypothetical protein ACFFC7_31575 [Candidatus Hermodarchaeota archaeon]
MKDKWRVTPKRIGRSRKIQVRQFEPEEIFIEYELDISDPSLMKEAVQEATQLAVDYLDEEERKLRGKAKPSEVKPKKERERVHYNLEITNEGKKIGNFQIKTSEDPQFINFLHLWLEKDQKELYVGYLRKDTGVFKFKAENKELIQKYGIKKGKHFRIVSHKSLNS